MTSAKLALGSWQQVSHLMASNMSVTLPSHHNREVIGDLLSSGSSKYLVESVLGQGTFGTVAKCRRIGDNKTVAIKMMRNQDSLVVQAREEVAALLKLQLLDSDKCNLVRWYQVFTCEKYICLEFEHLDKSLHDVMEDRSFQPLHLKEIRPIVKQLANALAHLKAAGIIHADLKLENIMLVNHAREPYRVKVIDFGLAHDVSAATQGAYLQTRPYRSPEIILGLPYTEAIDMWSLGCVTALLYLGFFLYPGTSGYDMMRCIVETQGQPPDTLLTLGHHTGCFFQRDDNSTKSSWKLKTPEQFYRETGIQSTETRCKKFSSLYDILHIQIIRSKTTADKVSESNDRLLFGDILRGMLALDAAKRLTPCQVLQHQFTSMHHMVSRYHLSSYVRSCYETMDLCQNLTTDSGKAVGGSLQPSSSGTAHPVQQNRSSASAERGALSRPQGTNPHPCSMTQTSGSINLGMKRKVDEENDTTETSHPSEMVRSAANSAAPSSSSSSSYFSPPRVKRNMADGDDSDNLQLYNHK